MASRLSKPAGPQPLPWLYIVGCLLILAGVATPLWRWSTPAKAEAAVAPINASPWRLQNIEAIRVGQRVVTDAANRTESLPTAVDPAIWRRVTIVGTREMASGKKDRIVVQTIVPPTWLEFLDAHVGAVVPYPLDLVEMGIPEELDGEITDIAPCPEILDGPGRVVLTTDHHLSHDVWQLELTAEDGTSERLKSTGFHPFYSVDRGDYVQVHELRAGERLQGSQGLVTLQAKKPVAGYHEVYNLTVEEEHVYRVGGLGTLVHNMQCVYETLRGIGDDAWESAGGLHYVGRDPQGLDRVMHVLRHADDIPGRAGRHGVFDAGQAGTLGVLDEAWAIAQGGGSAVSVVQQGNRTVYTIDMGRRVGYVGGQAGAAAGNPTANHVFIVIENLNQVISAFPIIP